MSRAARLAPYSFEDFCALVKDGQKADLINGVIYMASPDNTDANDLSTWLVSLMHLFVEEKELGKIYGLRVAFRLGETNGPEPDVAFVRKDRLHLVKRGFVQGGRTSPSRSSPRRARSATTRRNASNTRKPACRNTGSWTSRSRR